MALKPSATIERIAWLEGVRIFAAVMILLYHAQLLMTHYAYTPQPTGLQENLRSLISASERLGIPAWGTGGLLPGWFGFQFVDVFVLMSGFSLVLSLKDQPLKIGTFLKRRSLRILMPFWTVAWLSYPVLWLIGTLTCSYIPHIWYFFAAITFPLLFDYSGELLLPISGPWWFVSLILSFTIIFPFLWSRLQQWRARNLLIVSTTITLGYRALAVYAFGGHPTYVILDTPANWFPFLAFLAKLSTFVVGMVVGQAYLQRRGPLFWRPLPALLVGLPIYMAGFVSQFYAIGWIGADLLTPIGLSLCCMAGFKGLEQLKPARPIMLWLGAHSYSYFLVHNFVVDRTINLFVQDTLWRYYLALPLMIIGALVLAQITDRLTPLLQRGLAIILKKIDSVLTPAKPAFSSWAGSISRHG